MEVLKSKSIKELAKEEIFKEKQEKAVKELKKKYRELYDAKCIVKNIEREIEDIEQELEIEFADQQ